MEETRLLEEKLDRMIETEETRKAEVEAAIKEENIDNIKEEFEADKKTIEDNLERYNEDKKAIEKLKAQRERDEKNLEKHQNNKERWEKEKADYEAEIEAESDPKKLEKLQGDLDKLNKEIKKANNNIKRINKSKEDTKRKLEALMEKYEINKEKQEEQIEEEAISHQETIEPQIANPEVQDPEAVATEAATDGVETQEPKKENTQLDELRRIRSEIDRLRMKLGSHEYDYKSQEDMEKRLAEIEKMLEDGSGDEQTQYNLRVEKDRIAEIRKLRELREKHRELIQNPEKEKSVEDRTAIEKAVDKTNEGPETYIDYRLGHVRLTEKEEAEIRANGGISEAEAAARDGYLDGAEAGAQGQATYDDGPINGIPGKAIEKPEGPTAIVPPIGKPQPPRTPEPPTQPIPPVKPKGPKGYLPPVESDKLPVNSGLQQYRKQMNIIRDNYPIEKRHTLTERLPLPQALTTVGGAAIGAFAVGTFPLGLVPVAAGAGIAAAARPIAYRLTGQKQLEENIANQLRSMDESDFDLMVDYLSEEEVLQVKPNAVFLRALNKVMLEQAKDKQVDLTNEKRNLTSIQEQLLAQGPLTPEEERDLKDITERLEKIETEEAPTVARRVKDIKRGKDRVSQRYKGNLLTRFNIFAHRNSTSEEYDKPINEYADAEKKKLEGMRDGDVVRQAEGQRDMRDALNKHTFVNALGVQTSQFNSKEGAVKFVSDKRDNTARNVTRFGLMGVGFAKFLSDTFGIMQDHNLNVEEHQRAVDAANARNTDQLTDVRNQVHTANENLQSTPTDTVQQAADAEASRIATAGETGNLHTYRGDFGPAYDAADQAVQDEMSAYVANSRIKSGSYSEELSQLADKMSESAGSNAMHNLQDAAQTSANFVDVDHAAQFAAESGVVNNVEAQAEVVRKAAETARTIEDLDATLQQMDISEAEQIASQLKPLRDTFLGPVIMAVGTAIEGARDTIRNIREKKQNQALETDNER